MSKQYNRSSKYSRGVGEVRRRALQAGLIAGLVVLHATPSRAEAIAPRPVRFAAGSTTLCVVDAARGFDEAGGVVDGQRLIVVEAWYPIDQRATRHHPLVTFADYFAADRELMLRTERNLLSRSGFAEDVIVANLAIAEQVFSTPRGSYRDAPLSRRGGPFPVVLYSHGTLQQRFTNDALAESLAREGYIVLAPEHTGNDALAPLGRFCPEELALPGVIGPSLATDPDFDAARGEYLGDRLEPFFLVGAPDASSGTINPVEVALTLDRAGDYRAALDAARQHFGGRADILPGRVGLIGYSRGAMHGLVGSELLPEIGASVAFVGGTPLAFYERDAEAAAIHLALEQASEGARSQLDRFTKPVLEIIGGEDTRRKATTDIAASMGVYPAPSADDPSPIVADGFSRLDETFGVLVNVARIEHFDFVDDPFVVAYRAPGGQTRAGGFDTASSYVSREVSERAAIRDHFVHALFDRFIPPPAWRAPEHPEQAPVQNPFETNGVTVQVNALTNECSADD
jgi:dienelactone hydrolase